MIIDKEKLTRLLVEKTGLEKHKVEEQLLQLIRRVQQAAEQGRSFQIEGFGTFSVKDQTLHFDPVDTLETEINHKYAGMKPIELIGAFKETPEVEETEEEPDASSTDDQLQERRPEEEPLTDKVPDIQQPPESSVIPEESAVDQADDPGEEEKASFVFDSEDTKDEEQATETDEKVSTPSPPKKKKKDPIGKIITVCVLLLVVGLAGWAVYDFGLLKAFDTGTPPTSASSSQPVQPTPDPPVAESASDPSAGSSNATESDEPEQPPANSVPDREEEVNAQAGNTVYGLTGAASPGGNDGYTIVVHSLGSRSKARSMQSSLESEGFRTVLTSAVVDGETYWRVGLGQFESIAGAQEAANQLPGRYQNNHFIKRIQ